MKKIRNIFGYFILSVFLFFGGVTLNASPSGSSPAKMINLQDDKDRPIDKQTDKQADQSTDSPIDPQDVSLYYYSLLDETNQEHYERLNQAMAEQADSVRLEGISFAEAKPVYLSVLYDHPEYFWMENEYTYREEDEAIEFIFKYNCTGGEKKSRQRLIEQEASKIVKSVPPESTDYEKVKHVFDSLVDLAEYNTDDKSNPENQNIYSTFGKRLTVCAGYAKGTKYLLDQMGVECIFVPGMAGELHSWNIVNCDGAYYYVDTTWGDRTLRPDAPKVMKGKTTYEYLCCSAETLSRTHTADAMFPFPECSDTSLEYYRMKGRYVTSLDWQQIREMMKEDFEKGEKYSSVQFSEPALEKQAEEEVQQLMKDLSSEVKGLDIEAWAGNDKSGLLTIYRKE